MTKARDFNTQVIEEFRGNEGRVGGYFANVPLALLHHRGRRTGAEYVNPAAYQRDADDPDTIYVFASKGGAPDNPAWYANLVAAGVAEVEVGAERYPVTVTELHGARRDVVYARQVASVPTFGEYEEKTRGIRTIPVLALTRTR